MEKKRPLKAPFLLRAWGAHIIKEIWVIGRGTNEPVVTTYDVLKYMRKNSRQLLHAIGHT